MSSGRRRFEVDDHESYARPARRTRPRTKQRPRYDDATTGVVVTIDRGRYTCRVAGSPPDDGRNTDQASDERTVIAMRARPLGRKSVVVGDRVKLVGDVSGQPGTLARIVEIEERATVLRRTADDDDPVERVIVANADQLVIVTALADPPPRPRLIDRCLVAAYDANLDPLLCLTKSDLASADDLLETYRPLGVPSVVTRHDEELAPVLHDRLAGRVSVLVGHSGVGKSTLVNALVPDARRAIGEVSEVTGRGRHTSTQAVLLALPFGGWIVDTPGIRSFGLAHVDPNRLIEAFPDLDEVTKDCPRGCTHARSEPECALDEAVADGRLDPARVESYRRLLDSRERHTGD
ncbi:ribosome small subunit-dependent GTPase A [Actinopolymorpha alba]|uniref:ribosome small subunit-dependent GTPase A n=1 Tax=Actinopolymorpha alba TaxID=533267 RepID=UPI00035C5A83|nr:ribosome small subunit-dependent GTPase A [Actinopolymorpha alba]